MRKESIESLLDRYLLGQCSREEELHVHQWFDQIASQDNEWTKLSIEQRKELAKVLYKDISKTLHSETNKRVVKIGSWRMVAAAVAILFVLGIGYFLFPKDKAPAAATNRAKIVDRAPGTQRAFLTLANGKTIQLDSSKGQIAKEGSIQITNIDGVLNYEGTESDMLINTITTPKGGQYKVVLGDGTRVWLNAASSIRFPISFKGETRSVEIEGEVYFEVARNVKKPFLVQTGNMQVEVLGTHFNINAYDDEELIETTLLEGKVKVTKGSKSAILYPGQQAQLNESEFSIHHDIDTDAVIAWKNGYFSFGGRVDLRSVMRQIARWYDLDVVYQGAVPEMQFGGKISRTLMASEVLKVLALSNVECKIVGRNLIVE